MSEADKCPHFDPALETLSEFLDRFNLQCSTSLSKARNNNSQKLAILVRALPVKVINNLQRRIKPITLANANYDDVIDKLKSQYEVKTSSVGAAFKLFSRKQGDTESIESYSQALNDLAADCDYKDCCRDRITRDVFVVGLQSRTVLSSVLQKSEKLSFNEAVSHAKTVENLSHEIQDVSGSNQTNKVSGNTTYDEKIPQSYVCIRCGTKAKHYAKNCYALNMSCNSCGKKGHLSKCCRSRAAKSAQAHHCSSSGCTKNRLEPNIAGCSASDLCRGEPRRNTEDCVHVATVSSAAQNCSCSSQSSVSTVCENNSFLV